MDNEQVVFLHQIEAQYGAEVAARAAHLAVRDGAGGPYLTPEEVEGVFADLLMDGRDC